MQKKHRWKKSSHISWDTSRSWRFYWLYSLCQTIEHLGIPGAVKANGRFQGHITRNEKVDHYFTLEVPQYPTLYHSIHFTKWNKLQLSFSGHSIIPSFFNFFPPSPPRDFIVANLPGDSNGKAVHGNAIKDYISVQTSGSQFEQATHSVAEHTSFHMMFRSSVYHLLINWRDHQILGTECQNSSPKEHIQYNPWRHISQTPITCAISIWASICRIWVYLQSKI